MPFFSKVFKRDGPAKSKRPNVDEPAAPLQPRWEESWSRKTVAPAEVVDLIHECTQEMKSRALDMPFLLLPFRPGSDPVGSKSFIRNFFRLQHEDNWQRNRRVFEQELKLLDPLVLVSVMKWCWSRLPGGVVTWETYDLFRTGELDSSMSKNAFAVFIPMVTESDARKRIVFDFFDLLAAIAARGKTNGLGGRKLSRMAGWWAFEHSDLGKGFDGGYSSWAKAADATSHLFFAYLRSLSPEESAGGVSGISQLPRSLQALLAQTEYPPETPSLMLTSTPKVVMIVNTVSPTPFALLRRARHFEFRDDDEALQRFSSYDDPVQALTDECRRVIGCVSNVNESASPTNGAPQDGAWSRFEDMGFSSFGDAFASPGGDLAISIKGQQPNGLRHTANSKSGNFGRPTTPSWADFLSTGFPDDQAPTLLPPEKSLPLPLGDAARGHSSQSHVRNGMQTENLEAGELASVNQFDLDETFWWVWMTSLAGEETSERKAVFGRCALIETQIRGAHWLVIEEQIKGASPGQEEGVYLAEKKSRFSWTRRGRVNRGKTVKKKAQPVSSVPEQPDRSVAGTPTNRLAPDQQAKVREAAARLKDRRDMQHDVQKRARLDETASQKTNSVFTLQPAIVSEAGPAMKWAKDFDRDAIRAAYLGDPGAGRGGDGPDNSPLSLARSNGATTPRRADRDLPALPREQTPPVQRKPVKVETPPATPPTYDDRLRPEPTTMAAFDEKTRVETPSQHPALRAQDSLESRRSSSPEASKKGGRKDSMPAAAASAPGGLKKLFGRKKADASQPAIQPSKSISPTKLHKAPPGVTSAAPAIPESSSVEPGTPEEPVESAMPVPATVPAASAPASAPPPSKQYAIPTSTAHEKIPTPDSSTQEDSPAHSLNRQINHPSAAAYRHPAPQYEISDRDQHDADKEFSRFDQGPLEDVPAFAPNSATATPIRGHSPAVQQAEAAQPSPALRAPNARVPSGLSPPLPIATASRPAPAPAAAAPSDEPSMTANDRWAQIRRNAAERAQRLNAQQEETRRQNQGGRLDKVDRTGGNDRNDKTDKTDDGDTSGEETIESRVARIKARVAELTGNMDTPGSAQPVGVRR